ncbi:MAG: FxsA family protein [Parvibaculum sp.]
MPFIFLAFVLIPLAEIGLFIQVGGLIGLWPTLFIVIGTAFAGTALLRAQGLAAFSRAQTQMVDGKLPVEEVVHGFCLVIAGALLLTPGFLTDAVGLLLFVPQVRLFLGRKALKWLAAHGSLHVYGAGAAPGQGLGRGSGFGPRDDGTVEGVAEEINPQPPSDRRLH